MPQQSFVPFSKFEVKPDKKVLLTNYNTSEKNKKLSKEKGQQMLQTGIEKLAELQDKLYAHNEYSMLLVFQAMDAAGKDSTIKHLLSGLNPTGVKVANFKVPSTTELSHDYFWRHYAALPARGEIGVFNRSHYENVLVTKVHPTYILNEKIPNINTVADIDAQFWKQRYKQINRFEKNIAENGTIIIKFFLHVSKDEQKKRFIERIDDPKKNWKFSLADLKERALWDDYQKAYEQALSHTSTPIAPWYIIPADDKWYMQLAVAEIVLHHFNKMELCYPAISEETKKALEAAKIELLK